MTARTEANESAALARSSRPGAGSLYSGRSRGPIASSSTITGTASRKTEPQGKRSRSTPPTSGPIAAPAEKLVIQIPIATVRCWSTSNMLRISDRVDGASVAPAIPSRARETISISGLDENAARTEAPPNAPAPMSSSRRRPIRSPSVPIVIRNPATRKP